ncbi:MAG: hypothetical protein AB7W16_00260 [Candidatus Obscuribacterales bacterium]
MTYASCRPVPRLPETLEELDVSNTDIEFLPRLPAGLKRLRADNCPRLCRLEALPDGIEHVTFWTCPELSALPPLPEGLKELWVVGTAVASLPRLPRSLEVLDARCNDGLVSICEDWPGYIGGPSEGGSLHWINLCNSPVAETVAGNLPGHVIAELRETGVSGWRFNALFHCVQYANEPFEPEPFVFC